MGRSKKAKTNKHSIKKRNPKTTILVLVEGPTEERYLKILNGKLNKINDNIIFRFIYDEWMPGQFINNPKKFNINFKNLLTNNPIYRAMIKQEECLYVFDLDDKVEADILGNYHNIKGNIYLTKPSFEFWLLGHHDKKIKYNLNSDTKYYRDVMSKHYIKKPWDKFLNKFESDTNDMINFALNSNQNENTFSRLKEFVEKYYEI